MNNVTNISNTMQNVESFQTTNPIEQIILKAFAQDFSQWLSVFAGSGFGCEPREIAPQSIAILNRPSRRGRGIFVACGNGHIGRIMIPVHQFYSLLSALAGYAGEAQKPDHNKFSDVAESIVTLLAERIILIFRGVVMRELAQRHIKHLAPSIKMYLLGITVVNTETLRTAEKPIIGLQNYELRFITPGGVGRLSLLIPPLGSITENGTEELYTSNRYDAEVRKDIFQEESAIVLRKRLVHLLSRLEPEEFQKLISGEGRFIAASCLSVMPINLATQFLAKMETDQTTALLEAMSKVRRVRHAFLLSLCRILTQWATQRRREAKTARINRDIRAILADLRRSNLKASGR